MIRKNAKDLCEVRINLACDLCFGKYVGKLVFAWDPVQLVDAVLLALADKVEATLDVVSCFACKSSILGNLHSSVVVDHEDIRYGW